VQALGFYPQAPLKLALKGSRNAPAFRPVPI
jgi:hypothetical protein